jgi:site-specific recombinase XerD
MLKEIEGYRNFLNQKRQAKATTESYLKEIKIFCDFYIGCLGHEGQSWGSITVDDVRQYRNHLVDLDKKVTTINHSITSMRLFYDYLMIKGVAEFNPFREINLFLHEQEPPQVLNDKEAAELIGAPMREYEAIIDSLAGQRTKAPGPLLFLRDQLILEIFYYTGLKISELMGLKDHDIDCHTNTICIRNKPNKGRVLPLPECVIRSFEGYLAKRKKVWPYRSAPALFLSNHGKPITKRSIGRMIDHYLMKSGLDPRISPQTLRATFALRAIKQGASPETIMYILGYESLSTAETYINLVKRGVPIKP